MIITSTWCLRFVRLCLNENHCVPYLAPEQGSCQSFPWTMWSSRIFWMKSYMLMHVDGANSGYISICLTASQNNSAKFSFTWQPDFHLNFSMKNYSSSTLCTHSITFYDSFNVHKNLIKERQLSLNSETIYKSQSLNPIPDFGWTLSLIMAYFLGKKNQAPTKLFIF